MSRTRIVLIAVGAGALVGLFSPLLFLLVLVGVCVLAAIGLRAWGEGREDPPVMATATPYVLFAGFAVLFWLIGRLGLVLGLAAALVLVIGFFALGGDLN